MPDFTSTCWTEIRRAAAGGDRERELFVQRYASVVEAYLGTRWRLSALRQDIEDTAQEVFVECLKEGGVLEKASPDTPGGFRAFLFGVTRNVAARAERRHGKREAALPEASSPGGATTVDDDPGLAFDRAWARALIKEASELHAERARELGPPAEARVKLLALRFEDGRPIREIAKSQQRDPAVLHTQFAQARKEFLRALRDVVAFHLPGSQHEIDAECKRLMGLLA